MNKSLVGQRFGRWLVLESKGVSGRIRNTRYVCQCDCGAIKIIPSNNLAAGHSKSCGCLARELLAIRARKQGTHRLTKSPTWVTWQGLVQRCNNPKAPGFHRYGGRGITVCARWLKFANFLADMGIRPKGYTIERIDNNGGYHPGNCKWATYKEQENNKSTNKHLTFNGLTLTLSQWADKTGIYYNTIRQRIARQWPIERILTEPTRTYPKAICP